MNKKILTGLNLLKATSINEAVDSKYKGIMKIKGIFSTCDNVNKNGRVYSKEVWETVLASPIVQDKLRNGRMLGEILHSDDDNGGSLFHVSHIVTDLYLESNPTLGTVLIGEAVILDNPNGHIIKSIFDAGGQVGVSSRAYGESTRIQDIEHIIASSYELITFDFVFEQSCYAAYPNPLKESLVNKLETVSNLDTVYINSKRVINEQKNVSSPKKYYIYGGNMNKRNENSKHNESAIAIENKKLKEQLHKMRVFIQESKLNVSKVNTSDEKVIAKKYSDRYKAMTEAFIKSIEKQFDESSVLKVVTNLKDEISRLVEMNGDLKSKLTTAEERLQEAIKGSTKDEVNINEMVNNVFDTSKATEAGLDRYVEEYDTNGDDFVNELLETDTINHVVNSKVFDATDNKFTDLKNVLGESYDIAANSKFDVNEFAMPGKIAKPISNDVNSSKDAAYTQAMLAIMNNL